MMHLYYAPGACSLAPHIVLEELQAAYTLVKVDLRAKKMDDGSDFLAINPKGYVPVLDTGKGAMLTEGSAMLQYLADQFPENGLLAAVGSMERYRTLEWLSFISTELHKSFGPLFNPAFDAQAGQVVKGILERRLSWLASQMHQQYLLGDQFTIADPYLFTVLNWTKFVGMNLGDWPELLNYVERLSSRPAIERALRQEGL